MNNRIIIDTPRRFSYEACKKVVDKITDETKVIFIGHNREEILKKSPNLSKALNKNKEKTND